MWFSEVAEVLRARGYTEKETTDHHRVFYEFSTMDFLYSDCAKKFDIDYKDGKIEKIVMTQYWFGTTSFTTIESIEDLEFNV